MYEMPLGWENESDRFIAGAGWNWKSGGYWRQEWDDIGGSVGRSRAIRTRRKGKGGKEKDVRYDMCAVQRAMRWMNPTGCWKAMCLDWTRKLGNAKPQCRMKFFSV